MPPKSKRTSTKSSKTPKSASSSTSRKRSSQGSLPGSSNKSKKSTNSSTSSGKNNSGNSTSSSSVLPPSSGYLITCDVPTKQFIKHLNGTKTVDKQFILEDLDATHLLIMEKAKHEILEKVEAWMDAVSYCNILFLCFFVSIFILTFSGYQLFSLVLLDYLMPPSLFLPMATVLSRIRMCFQTWNE